MGLRSSAIGLIASADRRLSPPDGIRTLIYHRVGGGSASVVDLDVDAFRRQLEFLAEHHRVVSLDDAVTALRAGRASDDGVVITFDDGTHDFVDHAVPALVDAGLPATLYAATQFIDEGVDFPWGARPTTWAGLREAVSTGLITIGSHTHTHRLMDRLDPEAAADDIDRSIDLIGEHIGDAPEHFAYPKAIPPSSEIDRLVRHRFVSAALARSRVNRPGRTDLHQLWRTPIQRNDDADEFAHKSAGGGRLVGEARHQAARWRYRGATQ